MSQYLKENGYDYVRKFDLISLVDENKYIGYGLTFSFNNKHCAHEVTFNTRTIYRFDCDAVLYTFNTYRAFI